ncbi:hypothetical protein WOLCODRAFT_142886 [Wolfiporia cocos MD-104 SS10]|uniref:Uncharacterized protein n=1 Tax=Wolfiporia cocos (strain MD-104) TaxID=742152 RepID=A0A2H3JMK3_WOLCO|nr:hypothetical protein WOLCODRAFT_142886 [Wolfiporia cocos MD-104 SS10]
MDSRQLSAHQNRGDGLEHHCAGVASPVLEGNESLSRHSLTNSALLEGATFHEVEANCASGYPQDAIPTTKTAELPSKCPAHVLSLSGVGATRFLLGSSLSAALGLSHPMALSYTSSPPSKYRLQFRPARSRRNNTPVTTESSLNDLCRGTDCSPILPRKSPWTHIFTVQNPPFDASIGFVEIPRSSTSLPIILRLPPLSDIQPLPLLRQGSKPALPRSLPTNQLYVPRRWNWNLPRFPAEIIALIIDALGDLLVSCTTYQSGSCFKSLRNALRHCALTCSFCCRISQRNLMLSETCWSHAPHTKVAAASRVYAMRCAIDQPAQFEAFKTLIRKKGNLARHVEAIVVGYPRRICTIAAMTVLESIPAPLAEKVQKLEITYEHSYFSFFVAPQGGFWQHLHKFSSVSELHLSDVRVGSRGKVGKILCSLPSLRALHCTNLRWITDLDMSSTQPQETSAKLSVLQVVSIRRVKVGGFVDLLLAICADTIPLKQFTASDCRVNLDLHWCLLNRLFKRAGKHLQSVGLYEVHVENVPHHCTSDGKSCFLDMSENTNLRMFTHIDPSKPRTSSREDDSATSRAFAGFTSPSMTHITMTIWCTPKPRNTEWFMSAVDDQAFKDLDDILCKAQFSALISVRWVLKLTKYAREINRLLETGNCLAVVGEIDGGVSVYHNEESCYSRALCRYIRSHMPRTSARGILSFRTDQGIVIREEAIY